MAVTSVSLPSTSGVTVRLDRLTQQRGARRAVVFCYPRNGRPDEPLPPGWDAIPGARGCTPEACGFRDTFVELTALDCVVLGMSTQSTAYQQDHVERNALPYEILSDAKLEFAHAMRLPTFTVSGMTLLKRLTLVIANGVVEHAFYPVFPPDRHADQVVQWLAARANDGG
ncbi:MAG: redoxin family protein [Nitriliruptorales bacterium]|nr:redoxin family protein [Nitriliruptorales bacterium]